MKILVCGDVHWSEYSSIIRSVTDRHSLRLENLIKSINWVLDEANNNNCDMICFLGDFFDKESLNSKEITALNDIDFNKVNVPVKVITGNHEMGSHDLFYNSCNIFNSIYNFECISKPSLQSYDDFEIAYLPYVLESNRKHIEEYFCSSRKKRIIFSHNDISGIQLGTWKSTSGFPINEIENNCDLFINGHIHSGSMISEKVINLGNITGQNFSEDAFLYQHRVAVIDTDDLSVRYIENPFAFNFYKIDMTDIYKSFSNIKLKNNAVVSLSCIEDNFEDAKKFINDEKIVSSRITVAKLYRDAESGLIEELSMSDHLSKFRDFAIERFGSSEIVVDELNFVLK